MIIQPITTSITTCELEVVGGSGWGLHRATFSDENKTVYKINKQELHILWIHCYSWNLYKSQQY